MQCLFGRLSSCGDYDFLRRYSLLFRFSSFYDVFEHFGCCRSEGADDVFQ